MQSQEGKRHGAQTTPGIKVGLAPQERTHPSEALAKGKGNVAEQQRGIMAWGL